MNSLIRTACLLLVPGIFGLGCGGPPPIDLVVLVTLDTVRADHLGTYGYPRETSPFIDSLAERGVVFERAVSSSSFTAPAHASIFTSLHPFEHRVLDNGQPMQDSLVTLAELLREHGYETAAFVSTKFIKELHQGFDHFDYPFAFTDKMVHRSAAITMERALDWLERPERSTRTFVWLHLFDAHQAHGSQAPAAEEHRGAIARGAPGSGSLERFLMTKHGVSGEFLDDETLEVVDRYDTHIRTMDAELRRLFEEAGRDPRNADAVWIVTADHGEGLWNHGNGGHGSHVYQEQLRVPLIVHFTGRPVDPSRVPALVRHIDLLPTVLELVGAPASGAEGPVHGRSLMALIRGKSEDFPATYAFSQRRAAKPWETIGELYSLQDQAFKYIARSAGPDEFYDLARDPFESRNLIDSPSPALERFRRMLRSRYREPTEAAGEGEELPPIAPEYREELKALGYLDESP